MDTALLRMMIDTGARVSEIANLTMEDVDLDAGTITVVGKGRRVRALPSVPSPFGRSTVTSERGPFTRRPSSLGFGSGQKVASPIAAFGSYLSDEATMQGSRGG